MKQRIREWLGLDMDHRNIAVLQTHLALLQMRIEWLEYLEHRVNVLEEQRRLEQRRVHSLPGWDTFI